MDTDLKGLNSFKEKLKSYSNINAKFRNGVINAILERALQIAREEYSGLSSIDVGIEKVSTGMGRLYAKGESVAYIEFGTGLVGEASQYPKDKLPTQKLEFESPKDSGKMQQTDGWEYYYDNPDTKIMGGWFWGKTFTRGRPAGMQMYRISQRLRQELPLIVRNKIKGDGAGV